MKTVPAAVNVQTACETEIANEFNFGMDKTKGAYLPFEMAFPARYVISSQIIGTEDAQAV